MLHALKTGQRTRASPGEREQAAACQIERKQAGSKPAAMHWSGEEMFRRLDAGAGEFYAPRRNCGMASAPDFEIGSLRCFPSCPRQALQFLVAPGSHLRPWQLPGAAIAL